MIGLAIFLIIVSAVIWGTGLLAFWANMERNPFQYLRWTPYLEAQNRGHELHVKVRRKSQSLFIASLETEDFDFANALAEAQSKAREKCIELNSTQKALKKALP